MSDKLQQIVESDAFQQFKAHCESNLASEMCGLFVLSEGIIGFVPCANHAFDTKNSFLIHPADFVKCMEAGDVIAVGHSHVTVSARASNEDVANSENCRLPFLIYQPIEKQVEHYWPSGKTPSLIGRKWHLGVSDCYTIVRDYFAENGVQLNDYVRNDSSCLHSESLFLKHYEENGFVDVTGQTPKKHDVALIQVLANIPNHAAVFVDDDIILHHLQGRLSCRDPYGGYWRRHTVKLLRHSTWL